MKIKTYLAGAIGVSPTIKCKEWRDYITSELEKIGIGVLNPLGKYGDRLGKTRKQLKEWNEQGDIDKIRKFSSEKIIPPDLKMVEEADFITFWLSIDDGYEICGSYGETTLAFYLKKPVYVITERNLKPCALPNWLIGCSTQIFTSWKAYLSFIKRVYITEDLG